MASKKTQQYAEEMAKQISNEFGIKPQVSLVNGVSMYINYRGWKVRFSDHETSTFSGRHLTEVQVHLGASKKVVDEIIDAKDPDNWTFEEVTFQNTNTEYGVKKMYPKAVKIEQVEPAGFSKKGDPLYVYNVTIKKAFNLQTRLKNLISEHLDNCCSTKLPRLKKYISTPEGREYAEDLIFEMCRKDGIAVQTAMSALDSEL